MKRLLLGLAVVIQVPFAASAAVAAATEPALEPKLDSPTPSSPEPTAALSSRPFSGIFDAWALHFTAASAGPLIFRDTPDGTLDPTTVFAYGGGLTFVFGDELVDPHRLGVGLEYASIARSKDRELKLFTPHLTYEVGHPLELSLDVGWALASGTADFASPYGGFFSAATLGWSFRRADQASPIGVSLGVTGEVVLNGDGDRSSAFLGARLSLTYHRGGAR